ncbi:T9SS type A sorting domain-containing protein [Pontibacter korlensis]|uniref:T9SS type A sorting domain-containing protein n=1 Tax=Pontibacter korlensis TaxID=400092 RepID=UPI00069709AC|nr:T9SS type A sorting domain-containing protein [Pontibacter korlensis]
MKRYILFFTLFFLTSVSFAQAQRPTPTGGCVQDHECYRFEYHGATQVEEGLMQVAFSLQVKCDELAYLAFEVPEGSEAAGPASVYQQNARDYRIRNGFASEQGPNKVETPYNAIQFNAKQNYSLSGGEVDTFMFNLTQADFEALSTMRVRATLRSGTNGNRDIVTQSRQVVFDLNACSPTTRPDACVVERDAANFAFIGATDNGDGTTTVQLYIENKADSDVSGVTIETEDTPDEIGVAGMNNGGIYQTENFIYRVDVDQEANLITFDAQNTNGYANGAADVFAIVVPNDLYELAPYFLMSVTTANTFESAGLNTISCEDEPITPLPVELVSFEGKATQSGVALEWTTASEENNDRFEIERSQDGKSFNKIAEVKGAGNSVTTLNYSYTDETADTGLHYYRLKQIDFDGQYEFSKVVAVKRAAVRNASFEVYPNPATTNYLQVAMHNDSDALLQIMDRNGRTVYTQEIGEGAQQVQLSISELNIPKGLYYVHLQGANGRQVQKLIVQ